LHTTSRLGLRLALGAVAAGSLITCSGNSYAGWYTQMDGDTGCYNTAFKLGMTHTGYETIGCEMPDANFLDDGPTTEDDRTGELYYR
jgi:hypothetical protein